MPDDHPGLAAAYHGAQHPTRWTVAQFDWFSDEYTVLGRAGSEAEAQARVPALAQVARCEESSLVVLAPRVYGRRMRRRGGGEGSGGGGGLG